MNYQNILILLLYSRYNNIKLCFFFFLEICNKEELPEVELISLLEETIPQYKLRADTLTQFTGKN